MDIVLATRNKKKVEEIKRIAVDLPITVLSLSDYPECRETIEDQETFEGNAIKKAREVCQCTGRSALADDSGLEVAALNGAPGIFSARYAGESGPETDKRNYEKLLNELRSIPEEQRNAQFVCCLALVTPKGMVKTFTGTVKGYISLQPHGITGFGYDPVFIPEGHDRTFAEMSSNEKDMLSHRGKAVDKFHEFIRTHPHL